MRKAFLFIMALILLGGCGARRLGDFAPRRPDIPDHRGVTKNAECVECHDVEKFKNHTKTDNCVGCHNLIPRR